MKKIIPFLFLICCVVLGTRSSHAQSLYAGGKVGWLLANETGFSGTFSGGIYGGVQIEPITVDLRVAQVPLTIAAEGEFTTSLVDGDTKFGAMGGSGGVTGTWKIMTLAAYGVAVYNITDAIYIKGRLGVLVYGKGSGSSGGAPWSHSDVGLSGGGGAGLILGPRSALEAELTGLAENLISANVGYRFRF